jgi:DNA-binding PadR family transcriptional regulator
MSMRLLVLGTVDREGVAYGYRVYRTLLDWQAQHWAQTRPGGVYHALSQMEKEGLLQTRTVPTDKRSSSGTEYRLTPSGMQELLYLTQQALIANEQESFAVGLAFMHKLPRRRVLELVRERLVSYQEGCAFMHGLPRQADSSDPSTNPAIIDSWTALFDATEAWLENFIGQIQDGCFVFAGEPAAKTPPPKNSSL